jgi:hypothetical protein
MCSHKMNQYERERYERLRPEEAFEEATTILSRTNPRDAWSLCALFSTTEAFGKDLEDLLFFPSLNFEKVRMLCEVALDSKALDYKTGDLSTDQIIDVLNYGHRALTDHEGIRLMEELRGKASQDLAILIYFSRLGNVQQRYQDPRFHERVGRLIGMIEELPRTHRHKMPAEFWAKADPTLKTIREFIGFPILSLASGILGLLELYGRPYQKLLGQFNRDEARKAGPVQCLRVLLDHRREWQPRFILAVKLTEERTYLTRFLELFARTTRQLRELRQADLVYRSGDIARRLSPLERYPVVRLSNTEIVIPNVRYLCRSFTDIIHFSLLEERVPDYDLVRGRLQELYLHVLLETRLSGITIIPERSYRRGKQQVKGADLTLIEDDRLILIESKAKRMRVETRLGMLPEELLKDLGGAVDAIGKSEEKIAELCGGIPEYSDAQEMIDRTKNRPPITVVVLGEEITMMGEVINEFMKSYPDYPLAETKGLFCILGIDAFERAVEVAATTGKRLGDLLEEYIAEAAVNRPETPRVDEFGGSIDLESSFAVSFLHE